MSIQEILTGGGGTLLVLLTLIQFSPVKINPWSAVAKVIKAAMRAAGRAFNADVLKELAEVKEELQKTKTALNDHVTMDDKRTADGLRTQILAWLDKPQIAEELSKVALAEIIAPVIVYALKSVVENLSKNNRWPDKQLADTETTPDQDDTDGGGAVG